MYAMSHSILIVDDDPHIRQLLAFALGKAGLDDAEAGDGEAALAAVARDAPDLVVLDINMPRMDGLEVCRRMRAAATCRSSSSPRATTRSTGSWARARRRRLCGQAVQPARGGGAGQRHPGAAAARRAEPGAERPVGHGRLRLDPEGWRRAGTTRWSPLTVTEFGSCACSPPRRRRSSAATPSSTGCTARASPSPTAPIDSHVRNLRAKFAARGGGDVIETRAGIGYRLGPCLGGARVIRRAQGFAKRHWPRCGCAPSCSLTFLFVAALPGVGAVFLRVYENTLVRQTEAELVAQGAALAGADAAAWGRRATVPAGLDPQRPTHRPQCHADPARQPAPRRASRAARSARARVGRTRWRPIVARHQPHHAGLDPHARPRTAIVLLGRAMSAPTSAALPEVRRGPGRRDAAPCCAHAAIITPRYRSNG